MAGFGSVLGALGGGAIGAAVVNLRLNATQYQAQLKAAQGQTVASANAMGQSTSRFGAMAGQAFAVAGVAVAAFAASSVKAAVEANEAHLKLQNTFANNASLADSSVAAFEAQADSLRDLTGVDDEAIISSQALLGQFDLTGQQVMELTPLIVDLSAKMGISLEAAAKAVGKATQGSTGALARYGIILETTSSDAEAYTSVLDGLSVAEGFAAARADDEPWRVLGETFEELQETLGKALLPSVRDMTESLTNLLKVSEPLIQFVFTALADVIASAARETESFLEPINEILSLLPQASEDTDGFNFSLGGTVSALGTLANPFKTVIDPIGRFQEAFHEITGTVQESSDTILGTGPGIIGGLQAIVEQGYGRYIAAATEAGQRTRNFAHLSSKEVTELRQDVIADFDQMAGGLTNLSRKWELTAEAAVRATNIIAERQQIIARDLGKLDDLNIGEGLKKKLLELGPDMVHAFITGNRNQREKIRENLRGYDEAMEDTTDEVQDIAHKGGVQTGDQFIVGAIEGIINNSKNLAQAAADAVTKAISAAQQAAGAKSPSQVMMRLGRDMIRGLIIGLASEDEALVKAATEAIEAMTKAVQREFDKMTRAFEKQISKLEGQLSRVQSQASSLRGAVTGGFSSFGDISGAFGLTGTDIGGFFASQVSGAQQFASVLNALQAQGASAGLLSQIAQGGPEAIPFAQSLLQQGPGAIAGVDAALQTIADLAGATGKGLSEAFFGERIDDLRDRLKDVHSEQREQTRMFELMLRLLDNPERLLRRLEEIRDVIGNITVEIDSQRLGDSMHSEFVRRNRRSGSLQLT